MGVKASERWYFLKLNERFFEEDTIQWLEEQPNGVYYSNIYLKLVLRSLRTNGMLARYVGEKLIPYDAKALSKIVNVKLAIVKNALRLFQELGLMEVLENGEIFFNQINELVGNETEKAKRMREKRASRKSQKMNIANVQKPHNDNDLPF